MNQESRKLDILVSTFIQMYLGMSLECCASSERLATHLATVWTDACVPSHVKGKTISYSEPHPTHQTWIRLLSSMYAFMLHFVTRSKETTSTEAAHVGALDHMRLDMCSQKIHVHKYLATMDTRVFFGSSVDSHVHVEVAKFTEDLVANWTTVPQEGEMLCHMFLHINQSKLSYI